MTIRPILPHHRIHRKSYNDTRKTRFVQPGQFDDAEEETEQVQQVVSLPIFRKEEISRPVVLKLKLNYVPDYSTLNAETDKPDMIECDKDATAFTRTNKLSSDQTSSILAKNVLAKMQKEKPSFSAQPTISRAAKVKSKMTSCKKNSSNSIGVYHWRWLKNLHELSVFREERGHCRVPQGYPANPKLGTWVHNQRQKYKLGVLDEDRVNMLDRLGFQWVVARGGERTDYPTPCSLFHTVRPLEAQY